MWGTVEPRFTSPNDQRLFDQKAIDVVVMPNDAKVVPVHVMIGCFFVFGNRRRGIDVLLSFGRRVDTLLNVVCVGHRISQCYCPIADSRWSTKRRFWLLLSLCLRSGCFIPRWPCLLSDVDWFDDVGVVVVRWVERVLWCIMFTETSDCWSFHHAHVSLSPILACRCVHFVW